MKEPFLLRLRRKRTKWKIIGNLSAICKVLSPICATFNRITHFQKYVSSAAKTTLGKNALNKRQRKPNMDNATATIRQITNYRGCPIYKIPSTTNTHPVHKINVYSFPMTNNIVLYWMLPTLVNLTSHMQHYQNQFSECKQPKIPTMPYWETTDKIIMKSKCNVYKQWFSNS